MALDKGYIDKGWTRIPQIFYKTNEDKEYKRLGKINNLSITTDAPMCLPKFEIRGTAWLKELKEIQTLLLDFSKDKKQIDLPERYIINKNACILFWKNGDKTVVKRAEGDEFNPRLAYLYAFFQHYCGMSKNKANKYLASLELENDLKIKENKTYVTVVDVGETYSTYKDYVVKNFPKYKNLYKEEESPEQYKEYELIGKARHGGIINTNRMCALIQDIKTKQVYVIGVKGIKEDK